MKSDIQQLVRTTELCEPAGVMLDMDRRGHGREGSLMDMAPCWIVIFCLFSAFQFLLWSLVQLQSEVPENTRLQNDRLASS